jgi:hypothetical protein
MRPKKISRTKYLKEAVMNNPNILFKIAEAHRLDLIKDAENYRLAQEAKKAESGPSNSRIAWALMGTTLAAVLVSLIA